MEGARHLERAAVVLPARRARVGHEHHGVCRERRGLPGGLATRARHDGLWIVGESSNGTLLNGELVRSRRRRLHDRISVGRFLLVLSAVDDVPYEMRAP